MPYISDHQQKFADLDIQIKNRDQLRLTANGGNSILFIYPPEEESLYIDKVQELYAQNAIFINVSRLFVKFIDEEGWECFKDYYSGFKDTPHKVFDSADPAIDLFDMIIHEIEEACKNDKIPILVRTGCLYGTGIENATIMENKTVMALGHPLIIFYPSKTEGDNLLFLNFKPASKYRCALVK